MPASVAHWEVVHASVVLIAHAHNPSIINADFLRHNGIVPSDWREKSDDSLVTPIISKVNFGKLQLEVTPECLTVSEKIGQPMQAKLPSSETLYRCVKKYIDVLPHIPYRTMGINWHARMEIKDSLGWFKRQFLADRQPWDEGMAATSLTLKQQVDEACICTMTTTVDSSTVVSVNSNFHLDFSADAEKVVVARLIDVLDSPQGLYSTLVENIAHYCSGVRSNDV